VKTILRLDYIGLLSHVPIYMKLTCSSQHEKFCILWFQLVLLLP